jgi:hypothetical protein
MGLTGNVLTTAGKQATKNFFRDENLILYKWCLLFLMQNSRGNYWETFTPNVAKVFKEIRNI